MRNTAWYGLVTFIGLGSGLVMFVVLALMLVPVTVEGIYTHAVFGAQRYDLTTQTSTVKMALHLLASIVVVALGFDILGLVLALMLGTTVSCFMQRARACEVLAGPSVPPPAAARAEIRGYVASLAVVAVLEALVRDRSEIFFLRLYAPPEEIAFYSLAFGLATRVMVIPEIAVGALLPTLSALHGRGDRNEFERVYRTAMRYVALSGAPIAALVAALAPGVIHWLYGAAYLPAARLLGVLALVAVLGALRQVAAASLRAVGERHCGLTGRRRVTDGRARMRILITGGAGFIGSNVTDAFLAAGHDVAVVDDLSSGSADNIAPRARVYRVDIRDAALDGIFAEERPEVVCHHAAQVSVRRSVEAPQADAEINVLGSLNVFGAARRHGTRRLVFASTGGAIYGEQTGPPADETHPCRPRSPYAVAKLAVEHYLDYFRATFGLEAVVLRYANVYGPRQDPHGEAGVVAIFMQRILAGLAPTIFGDGEQVRDFVYVEDVVTANLAALRVASPRSRSIYRCCAISSRSGCA